VWLRRLATDRIARRCGTPPEAPFVIVHPVKNALVLAAVNDAAAQLGLNPGMALADAKAMYPRLNVADAEPDTDARLLEAIADWCDRYTPLIGLDPPDGLLLDITGCAHLFGGEAALCLDIVRRLDQQGLAARGAIADTAGGAWAVARYGGPHPPLQGHYVWHGASSPSPRLRGEGRGEGAFPHAQTRGKAPSPGAQERADLSPQAGRGRDFGEASCLIVTSGHTREALLPLRLAALRIAPEVQDALAQVGLKRIADVIDRPRAPLAARFGTNFIRRLDQALGREDEPITPRLPVPACVAERRFAESILLEADVLGTIELLAHELARILERRGEGARRLQVALFRTDGKVERAEIGTGAPLRDPVRIRSLFGERLAALGDMADPGFGFDVIRLAALATERCDPKQTGLAAPDHAADLAHLIDRLGARFGLRRVTRLAPQDTHIPEFAVAAVPAADDGGRRTDDRYPSSVVCPLSSDSLASARPLRLFTRPEPIEAIAEVPDGPPVRFRWRHVLHQVAHAEGPERIAMEWWRDEKGRALTRDYFRIESQEGVRAWLYREGLYGQVAAGPRWFLHGLFA
jgi:protein ImuB